MTIVDSAPGAYAQAGPLTLHYHEYGAGHPVICLHGGGPGASGLSNFSRNVEELAASYRVFLIDQPGYGQSDKPKQNEPYSTFNARAIDALMTTLGISSAHFIGNSMGGATSIRMAIDYPHRVDRLILMGPGGGLPMFAPTPSQGIEHLRDFYEPPGPSMERFRAFLRMMVYDTSALTDELIEQRYAAATAPGIADNFPLRKRNLIPERMWTDLNRIKAKTLLIWGRDDRTIPLDNALIMLAQIPDVRLHVFSKCGHWAQWEKAEEFNRLTLDFLSLA
jgi:4,5:9,10-diseco-3-hydroxy-5,9,17-trioxoandrosta-1(10),2-diene-4-oate hydrolase